MYYEESGFTELSALPDGPWAMLVFTLQLGYSGLLGSVLTLELLTLGCGRAGFLIARKSFSLMAQKLLFLMPSFSGQARLCVCMRNSSASVFTPR